MGIELFTRSKEEPRLQRSGERLEGALGAQQESTSAAEKGRPTQEDALSIGAFSSSKEENEERTQEWWEGYDPGMDVGF
jgi:hypothetical protein